jgi:uncharacterized protein YijF (DUF1287 family)
MFLSLLKWKNIELTTYPRGQDTLSQVINNGAYAPGDMVSFRVDQNIGGNEPNA